MRIAPPTDVIQPYVRPINAEPLSAEVSRQLIASGVFDRNPNQTIWTTPGQADAGAVGHSASHVDLPGGIHFQPRPAPASKDSLLATLLATGQQSLPILEQCAPDAIADGVALLVSTPEIFHALSGPDRTKPQNLFRYGTSLVQLLNIANNVVHVPHAEESLAVAATIFKVGEQVFISREEHIAGS